MIEDLKKFYEANQKPIMAVLAVIALFLIYDNFMRSDSSSDKAAAPAETFKNKKAARKPVARKPVARKPVAKAPVKKENFKNKKASPKRPAAKPAVKKIPEGAPAEFFHFK